MVGGEACPEVIKIMLNSAAHEIFRAHKCKMLAFQHFEQEL